MMQVQNFAKDPTAISGKVLEQVWNLKKFRNSLLRMKKVRTQSFYPVKRVTVLITGFLKGMNFF